MEPPPLFAFKGFDQFANFESKLQHFCSETNLANMAHGRFPGVQTKWCWGQAAGGGPFGKPVFWLYFYTKLIGPCQEKIFYIKRFQKWPLPGEIFLFWHPQSWTFCQAWLPGLLAGGMLLWLPWVGNKGFRVCKNVWGSTSKMHRFCLVGAWLWLLGQSLDELTLICKAPPKRVQNLS